jgi:hypothetical protein
MHPRRRGRCFEQDGRGRTCKGCGLRERGSRPDAELRGPARNTEATATWWAAAGPVEHLHINDEGRAVIGTVAFDRNDGARDRGP